MKKNLRYFMTLLLMMVASVGWAQEEIANFSPSSTTGWTITSAEYATAGGGYYKLISSDASIVSPSISWSNYTDITITITARKYGGPNETQGKISVSQGTTELASYSPSGTSLVASSALSITPSDGTITISCPGASSSKGCGVQSIVIKGTRASTSTLSSIALSGTYPTTFNQGDAFSHEGMTVTATYDDNSTADVTSKATFSGYDMSTTGEQEVTVSYTEGEVTKTATYEITIKEFEVQTVTLPYSISFTENLNQWSQDGNKGWASSNYGAKISAGSAIATESWLISPIIDMTGVTNPMMTFEHTGKFFGTLSNEATLWALIEGGSWQQVTIPTYFTNGDWNFVTATIDLSAYANKKVQFAFKYVSTTDNYGTWEIKNFVIDVAKADPGLAFSSETATATVGQEFTAPTLTNPNGLTVSYASSKTNVATVANDGTVTIVGVGTTTITAAFAGNDNYLPGSASYNLTVIDPNAPGSTAENPYTVAQARAAIDDNASITGVYAKGIVSKVGTYNDTDKWITYWISDDGTTTDQLEAYKGKGIDGADFESKDDIQVGDVVIIKGNLQKYNSTYEFDAGNQLVSLIRPVSVVLAFNEPETTVNIGETVTNAATANVEDVTVVYSSSDESIATVNEEGVVTGVAAGTATITASIAETADYNVTEATYTITVVDPSSSSETNVATLSNADIVAAGAGAQGYSSWNITDANGKEWKAFAIKNQHSNATSEYHYLQIKKYDSNTAYYIQVPEYGSKITKLEMTVSGSSKPKDGGSNTATIFFSASNTTSATGDGVVSGGGASSITIDCSSLNLNTGYITASGSVRIWDVKVTYEDAESVTIKIAESGYTTLVSGKALDIANLPKGLTAYYVAEGGVSTDKVTLTQVTAAVPAETPLIFKGAVSTPYEIQIATGETTPLEGNKLAGYSYQPTNLTLNSAYILSGGEFHPTNAGTFPAGKAYLNVSAVNAKALTISFAETNGINNVNVENNTNEKVFNLAGQQMKSAVKGVYIKNGRKYVK